MTVLTIRKHSRFAVRHDIILQGESGRPHLGLLVELSLEGCRLTLPGSSAFRVDQPVTVRIAGFGSLRGSVRWTREGFVGIHFVFALHSHELDDLIQTCRSQTGNAEGQRAFGT